MTIQPQAPLQSGLNVLQVGLKMCLSVCKNTTSNYVCLNELSSRLLLSGGAGNSISDSRDHTSRPGWPLQPGPWAVPRHVRLHATPSGCRSGQPLRGPASLVTSHSPHRLARPAPPHQPCIEGGLSLEDVLSRKAAATRAQEVQPGPQCSAKEGKVV